MATISIVKLSELEATKRLDAEYYKPEYLEVKNKLLSNKFVYFKNLVREIIHPKEIKRSYEEKGDYLFLLAQNVRSLMFDFSEKKYISKEKAKSLSRNFLEKGDIVFVRTGNIGALTIYNGKPEKVVASAHILIAKPIFKHPFYVGVFLSTKFGQKILMKGVYGALQPEISPAYLKTIPIPIFTEEFIDSVEHLFFQAEDLLHQSQSLYSQAESLLLEELGLKDFKPQYKKTYTAKLSDVFSAHRIDAEYFQPAYEEVMEKLFNYSNGYKKLIECVEEVPADFNPSKYPDKIFLYVELADINSSVGLIDTATEIKGEEAPSRARRILKKNDLIVSSVEGSLEKVALVDDSFENALASTGFFQFRPKKILPEVLLVISKSIVLQAQLKRECSGTILTAVPKKAIKKLIIPNLTNSTQQKIASLVQQSHEARKKAKELLEIAKRAVEIAIEKGEKEALDYISANFYRN